MAKHRNDRKTGDLFGYDLTIKTGDYVRFGTRIGLVRDISPKGYKAYVQFGADGPFERVRTRRLIKLQPEEIERFHA